MPEQQVNVGIVITGTFKQLQKRRYRMKNPKWHRDEIILALDLYFDENMGPLHSTNPKIVALSELLNRLPIFQLKPDEKSLEIPMV